VVETRARKPSHLGSNAYPERVGSGEDRKSIGVGSDATTRDSHTSDPFRRPVLGGAMAVSPATVEQSPGSSARCVARRRHPIRVRSSWARLSGTTARSVRMARRSSPQEMRFGCFSAGNAGRGTLPLGMRTPMPARSLACAAAGYAVNAGRRRRPSFASDRSGGHYRVNWSHAVREPRSKLTSTLHETGPPPRRTLMPRPDWRIGHAAEPVRETL
jgi:hypothetical protein